MTERLRRALLGGPQPDPVAYVDNASRLPGMHPRAQAELGPAIEAMERSQQSRGARTDTGMDAQSPAAQVMRMARRVGYQGSDPAEAMQVMWQAQPTDMTAALLEAASMQLGVPPPWQQQQQQGGPPER